MAAFRFLTLAAIALLSPAWAPPPESQQKLALSAVRFYAPSAGQTQVKAFIQVPYAVLEPTEDTPQGRMTYHVEVSIRDSTGLELVKNAWDAHAPANLREPGASGMEMLDFAVAPGRYLLGIAVRDSVSGHTLTSQLPIEGFRGDPEFSDLLLAPSIRQPAAKDTLPGPGEINWDHLLITAAAEVLLTPMRGKLFYLMERYNTAPDTARLSLSIRDSTGRVLVSTPSSRTKLPVGGGIITGALDLSGLPAGRYRFTAQLTSGNGRRTQRSAEFTMADLSQTLAKEVSRREAERVTDAGYFASMNDTELDAVEEPLVFIAKPGELSAYDKRLSRNAKRRFLSEFWARRDPTPENARNEVREQFYRAIAYANAHFREGGRPGARGWKSDRGRVYARYGTPDEILRRQQSGQAPPYEVWRYTKSKDRYYIFADRTGVGAYNLIASNDLQETGVPNWQTILGLDVVQDISRFLGRDLIKLEAGSDFSR